jgi:hypothetical protein
MLRFNSIAVTLFLGAGVTLANPETFTTRANAYLQKAAYASAQLTLPEWFEPTARWRSSKPRLNTTRLDAAIARYAREYRMLYGPGHYREFAVAPPKTFADVVAAVDSALGASSREVTKREISGALDDERELRWILRGNRAIVMVHLSRVDPSRSDGPTFILLFEPK